MLYRLNLWISVAKNDVIQEVNTFPLDAYDKVEYKAFLLRPTVLLAFPENVGYICHLIG